MHYIDIAIVCLYFVISLSFGFLKKQEDNTLKGFTFYKDITLPALVCTILGLSGAHMLWYGTENLALFVFWGLVHGIYIADIKEMHIYYFMAGKSIQNSTLFLYTLNARILWFLGANRSVKRHLYNPYSRFTEGDNFYYT